MWQPPSFAHGSRFRLTKQLCAVMLEAGADGVIVQVPVGSVVALEGPSRISGLRDVVWKAKMYALFEHDLLETSEPE